MIVAYSETDSPQPNIVQVVDILDLATLTFTVTDDPIWVTLLDPYIEVVGGQSKVRLVIADTLGNAYQRGRVTIPANGVGQCWVTCKFDEPGEHTVKGRIQRESGTGTVSRGLGATEICRFIASTEPWLP